MNKKLPVKLLAIDTSTEHFSVCYFDGENYCEQSILGDAKSSSFVLEMIDKVLNNNATLDGIIYTQGPGAFTGVRVGISVAIGVSIAKNIPTMGFSTLEVLEFGAIQKFNTPKIVSSLDARMGEVYIRFDDNNYLLKPDEITQDFSDYVGVGSGFATYDNFAKCQKIQGDFYPQAKNLITMALNNLDGLTFKNPEPLYLRNNIAKKSIKNI